MQRSSEPVGWHTVVAGLAAWAVLAPALAGDAASHCRAGEQIFFSCHVGAKVVSLCGAGADGDIRSLSYRYGAPGHPENEYTATASNGRGFLGNVSPASPRASVAQVWFTRGDTSYLISTCKGGDCPYESGVAALRGDRVLMQRRCDVATDGGRSWFSAALVEFGSSLPDSRSKTPLLRLDAYDNFVEQLYPTPFDPNR